MRELVFATNNKNKLREANQLLEGAFKIISMADIGCFEDIPEPYPTLEGNALQKAKYIHQRYHTDCFGEDTGLEVEALGNAPGVYTARYAGPQRDPNDNMDLLLQNLASMENRRAQFRTIIALIIDNKEHLFEGIVKGHISQEKSGMGGFGYDPIFIPEGYSITFAEMDPITKNKISHRGQAVDRLKQFLLNYA